MPSAHWKVQSPNWPAEMLIPASGTEKLFSPAPSAASAALATSLQGLGMPMLADDSDEADEAEADAADADADEADADAADADVDEAEAELPLAEADALPEEPLEHPTTPSASTAAKTIASSFLFTMAPSLSIGASDGPLPPDAIPLVQTRFCSRLYQDG